MKKPLKTIIIIAPYVILVLLGGIFLSLRLMSKLNEDTIVSLVTNRGNMFEMHYDNSDSKHFLWVNGKPTVRTSPGKDEPTDEFIKEFVMSVLNDKYGFFSYLIVDNYIIYKTNDMNSFEVLGEIRTSDILNCENLLQDMDSIINHKYPIHATMGNEHDGVSSELNGNFGIYEGLGYRIEELTNGVEIEWQFYVEVYDRDKKIYLLRW